MDISFSLPIISGAISNILFPSCRKLAFNRPTCSRYHTGAKVTPNPSRSAQLKADMVSVAVVHSITTYQKNSEPRSRSLPCEHPYRYTSRHPYIGCSFLEGFEPNTQNLLQKGRPFILRRITEQLRLAPIGPSASLVERLTGKPERTERLLVCRSSC